MYYKKTYVVIIALTIFHSIVNAKKIKKHKRPSYEDEESTPQPNVIAYSTFGFNDVGTYNGFVPSSPDFVNYINGMNTETTTKLYAPAFPTSLDSNGYGYNYEHRPIAGQGYNLDEVKSEHSNVYKYPLNTKHFLSSSNDDEKNVNIHDSTGKKDDNGNPPEYGAKLNLKNKSYPFNNTAFNTYNNEFYNEYASSSDNKHLNFPDIQGTHETMTYGESDFKHQNIHNQVATYPITEMENFANPSMENKHNILNFPRVVDFTKMMHISYPNVIENSPTTTYTNIQSESLFDSPDHSNTYLKPSTEKNFDSKNIENQAGKYIHKANSIDAQGVSYNYFTSHNKDTNTEQKPNLEQKKKSKIKHWIHKNHTNDFKSWKDLSSLKEYEEYKNNFNRSFNYEPGSSRKPVTSNLDEITPESSNIIDFTKYQYNDGDLTNFKKLPVIPNENDYNIMLTKAKQNDYSNQYKYLASTVPTATSYWGNAYKESEYSPKENIKKYPYNNDVKNDDNVISITTRPYKYSTSSPAEYKLPDWNYNTRKPETLSTPSKDWSKDLFRKYRSEEDLLGLRNHDTSQNSYLPTQRPYENEAPDNEYKNALEKWKQSYLKEKYINTYLRNHDAFDMETKPLHVSIPKPYTIEVPHPVIVPVPQPYPVRIPVGKPVAVPVVREITIPIVKPVPYPVYKKVPYPIEKLVPVTVEKEVSVPISKPYPVHIPYVRPVFHHTSSMHEYDSENDGDDDYMPRPESSVRNVQYKRRPYSSQTRTRRPSRVNYHDRHKRLGPDRRRPSASMVETRYKRPSDEELHYNKHQERNIERLKDDHSSFKAYCKRKGIC